ncbi:MAG: hypothetical protein KAJ73_03025, partial [Zetaproteobacteria bacterium]|nr:hypothetical protein [Zetaproteobacteria bacterium]
PENSLAEAAGAEKREEKRSNRNNKVNVHLAGFMICIKKYGVFLLPLPASIGTYTNQFLKEYQCIAIHRAVLVVCRKRGGKKRNKYGKCGAVEKPWFI